MNKFWWKKMRKRKLPNWGSDIGGISQVSYLRNHWTASKTERDFSAEQMGEVFPQIYFVISPQQPWSDVQPTASGIGLVLKKHLLTLCSIEFKWVIWPLLGMLPNVKQLPTGPPKILEISMILPWTLNSTAWESLKPSSRTLHFSGVENLFVGSLIPFYPCPKA